MKFIDPFAIWIQTTSLAFVMRDSRWLWAFCETVHFLGLAVMVGVIGVLDLRILGVAKQLPIAPLHRLIPWGIGGFIANLITGFMFYSADAMQYSHNIAFQWKMAFVILAGINVMVFYGAGISHKAEAVGPGGDAPMSAKIVAVSSLFLWFGVMYWGRMLPFIGTAF